VSVPDTFHSGQLKAVFQPIVDLKNGDVFAHEALVRCSAPGLQSPPVLFEHALEQKVCGELGRRIRELAVEGCPKLPLFLNIHPAEFAERWLVQPDDPIFSHEPGVYLEITESVPLSHFELVSQILREVRGKGVGLVVDDLGAGYSNLRYIADLHPEVVKLDRGLVEALHTDERRQVLVGAIARLCKDLGAEVVAEGIETDDELDCVRSLGIRYVQGYLLARPAAPPPEPSSVPPPDPRPRRRTRRLPRVG
jgi:EAL domain-containing protein (putative c-di-GMP-specific phosphodiesterase class I)